MALISKYDFGQQQGPPLLRPYPLHACLHIVQTAAERKHMKMSIATGAAQIKLVIRAQISFIKATQSRVGLARSVGSCS